MTIRLSLNLSTNTYQNSKSQIPTRISFTQSRSFSYNRMRTARTNHPSLKLCVSSDDTEKFLTEEKFGELFKKFLSEENSKYSQEKNEQTKELKDKSASVLLKETPKTPNNFFSSGNLNIFCTLFTVISLYLSLSSSLTSKIDSNAQRTDDKFEKLAELMNKNNTELRDLINKNITEIKDLINIDIRTKITNLENKTDNIEKEQKNLVNKIDDIGKRVDDIGKRVDGIDKRIDGIDKKIDAKKGFFLHIQMPLDSFPMDTLNTKI